MEPRTRNRLHPHLFTPRQCERDGRRGLGSGCRGTAHQGQLPARRARTARRCGSAPQPVDLRRCPASAQWHPKPCERRLCGCPRCPDRCGRRAQQDAGLSWSRRGPAALVGGHPLCWREQRIRRRKQRTRCDGGSAVSVLASKIDALTGTIRRSSCSGERTISMDNEPPPF